MATADKPAETFFWYSSVSICVICGQIPDLSSVVERSKGRLRGTFMISAAHRRVLSGAERAEPRSLSFDQSKARVRGQRQ